MRKPGGSSPGPARSCWPVGRSRAMTCSWVCRPTGPRPRCATRGSSTTRAGSWSIGGPSGRASSACTRWEMPPRSPSPTASRSRRRACSRTRRRSRRAGNSPRRWQARRAGRRDEPAGATSRQAFDGHGCCWLETGEGRAAFADGDFHAEPDPIVGLRRPGRVWHAGKVLFERCWLSSGLAHRLSAAALSGAGGLVGVRAELWAGCRWHAALIRS